MRSRLGYLLLICINILVLGIFLYQYAGATYPMVGHDYRLFASRLIDTHLHYKVNGISIQWYTPSFGGGLPAYANPLQIQFSLPQFLLFFFDPWNSLLISSIIFAFLGFVAAYIIFSYTLGFQPMVAILGSALFTCNGFFIERVVVGHVNFITFPLITIYILAFLHPKLPIWFSGILIAIVNGVLVYSGGVYIGLIGLFSLLIILPIMHFLKPSLLIGRRLVGILAWGGIVTLLLCGSKLYATSLYMANFPRLVVDEYRSTWMEAIGSLIFQLVGVMTTTPFLALIGKSGMVFAARLGQWAQTPYGFWELDASLSPILLILLLFGAWKLLRKRPNLSLSRSDVAFGLGLTLAILLTSQFSIAKGFLFHALRSLPVMEALHVNIRFTAAFIFPLVTLGTVFLNSWVKQVSLNKYKFPLMICMNGLVLIFLWSYFLLPLEVQTRSFDMTPLTETYSLAQDGETLPVREIVPAMHDYEVFLYGGSNTSGHYEPLFRDDNQAFHPEVHEGSVLELENGYFNMTNPSGYLFPEENNTSLYERIREDDIEMLIEFINRKQPDWRISWLQQVLDVSAFICFCACMLGLVRFAIKRT